MEVCGVLHGTCQRNGDEKMLGARKREQQQEPKEKDISDAVNVWPGEAWWPRFTVFLVLSSVEDVDSMRR